jgi:hypothetical protein
MKLLQQPEKPDFILQDERGNVNTDPMTQCLYRGLYNQIKNPEFGVQYGMLLIWDTEIKHYDPFWGYHVWNVNEDETIIYDNFDLVKQGLDMFGYELKNPIENWKVKIIDGSNLKTKNDYYHCYDVIDKITKPHKGYDVIYLQNFGFRPDRRTQITWDMFESDCDETEEYLILSSMTGGIIDVKVPESLFID